MMEGLQRTSDLVKKVLTDNPDARDSDDILYREVVKRINPNYLGYAYDYILTHRKEMGLPNRESVRRARQKLQRAYPELRGSDDVEGMRMVLEDEYRDYALKATV